MRLEEVYTEMSRTTFVVAVRGISNQFYEISCELQISLECGERIVQKLYILWKVKFSLQFLH